MTALVGGTTGCEGDGASGSADGSTAGSSATASQTITVLAAASLTGAFEEIADDFEAAVPGTEVVLSFGSSAALALQVQSGAPADVIATADLATMDTALEGLSAEPVVFAGNDLVIAVAAGNPRGITGLADLTADGLIVSRCAPAVPCGKLAEAALDASGVSLDGASEAPDVKAAFAPLVAGQADAALVYRSDVAAASGVDLVELPAAAAQVTEYPISLLTGSATASAFVDYVLSDAGTAVLAEHGFTLP